MAFNAKEPITTAVAVADDIRHIAGTNASIVFVSGNFNILHPGHLRLLNFAADCGDFLVVGLTDDSNPGAFISQDLRLESLKLVNVVNYAFILRDPVEEFLNLLQPHIVVKGKEHEACYNLEQPVVESYGGKILFSSGEVRFSSLDLLQEEFRATSFSLFKKPIEFSRRHQFENKSLVPVINTFSALRVVVIGDLIVDEYITCDALGMSQEDPTIVVTPIKEDLFVGGAGIVAAHAAGLGAHVSYFGIVGNDKTAAFVGQTLADHGVNASLVFDESRPTTLKQRFRANGKTLLRVSHLKQHDISQALAAELLEQLAPQLEIADLVIFSDFNYGCLPKSLVDKIISHCTKLGVPMVADSQSSSQIGDVSRFKDMLLITPTEHEARLALQDSTSGLVVLADTLCRKARAKHVFITLGAEGMLVHSPHSAKNVLETDELPALNMLPKDVSGAGDCMLTSASMALVAGANVWESAFIGSVAAACQVSRLGNLPLTAKELKEALAR
ncbi:PfkB family carbohydrate kinase [Polynucleobacter sp. UB-Tiil-W10]|uniref:PfkB family carbohydrate kinase n=1 Tax=Polynucleobacter sp. UB-Tiil-W10 TaxID=1855648 RepID=UPI00351D8772